MPSKFLKWKENEKIHHQKILKCMTCSMYRALLQFLRHLEESSCAMFSVWKVTGFSRVYLKKTIHSIRWILHMDNEQSPSLVGKSWQESVHYKWIRCHFNIWENLIYTHKNNSLINKIVKAITFNKQFNLIYTRIHDAIHNYIGHPPKNQALLNINGIFLPKQSS